MITRSPGIITDEGVATAALMSCIREFERERLGRMERSKRYYDGEHAINSRVKPSGSPNNKVAAPYARYITTMASGYLAGSPIQYNGEEAGLDALKQAYDAADIENVDLELAQNASVYGAAVEITYFDSQARPRSSALDPRRAFVAYDDTAEHNPLLGILWRETRGADGKPTGYECEAHSSALVQTFAGASLTSLTPRETRANMLGRAPIVEYWNNGDEVGDFDAVIPLIDAYDAVQSDRVNDKQGFADSLLVFTGVGDIGGCDDADGRTVGQRLREDKAIALPDTDASVQWLSKSLNETDTQVLSDSLRSDIHKFAMVPDLSDQNFGGTVSGVSLRYKMFGLEQLTKGKQRWFEEGLRERLRLYAAALELLGEPRLDADNVTITFTRSLPINELEIAQEIQMLQGIVPNELLLTQLPFVSDAKQALNMLESQKDADSSRTDRLFGAYNLTAKTNSSGHVRDPEVEPGRIWETRSVSSYGD